MNMDGRLPTALACGREHLAADRLPRVMQRQGDKKSLPSLVWAATFWLVRALLSLSVPMSSTSVSKIKSFQLQESWEEETGAAASPPPCRRAPSYLWGHFTTASLAPEDHENLAASRVFIKNFAFHACSQNFFNYFKVILKVSLSRQGDIKARTGCIHYKVTEQQAESPPGSEAAKGQELRAGFDRLPPMEVFKKHKTPQQ